MSHNTPSLRLDSNSSFGTQRLNMDVSTVRDGDRDRSIARDREGELTREKFRESGRERDRGDRERDREERGRDTDADPNPPSSSSSYFIPNYPFSEPLFYIPRIPSITKVPEPQAPKRPPPAGYDMRTLRRQLSFLNEELGEQAQTQVLLHTQNEQLWMYVQDLLEANKANAHLMRGEVLRLHGELKHVHKERYQVAEKLLLARNSKSLLADLQRDLRETQLSAEEVEARKAEAETALLLARQESSSLAEALSSQAQQMQGVHGELEGYRQRQAEEQSLDLADSFFASNRAVLRAAYFRFRTGVQGRFRLSRIHSALERVYRRHLQRTVLDLWAHYLKRRQMMHRSRGHRRREALGLCLAQWQVFAALERLFSQARRRLVLQRCFRGWRAGAQEGRFEGWAVRAGGELRRQQWTRRVFQAWRGQTLFFEGAVPYSSYGSKRRPSTSKHVFSGHGGG
ncbi:hypothetical protein B484DRAFT_154676 [Ochromonadaceae sp. CCMP2298]|nr:hypothetical protein B484DRAFT_154676 [Ochromonadaceae sp. CCMP2298]